MLPEYAAIVMPLVYTPPGSRYFLADTGCSPGQGARTTDEKTIGGFDKHDKQVIEV
jgi:hypothetical protein